MKQEVVGSSFVISDSNRSRRGVEIADIKEIIVGTELDLVLSETRSEIVFDQTVTASQAVVDNWFYYKLRDRVFDGPGWQADRLTDWAYDKEIDRIGVPAVEESTYWLDPRGCLTRRYEKADRDFVVNPFEALPEENADIDAYVAWNTRWERITQEDPTVPYPGYFSDVTIPRLRRQILDRSLKTLGCMGYAQLTAVPTWFHIAKMYEHLGFEYSFVEDKERIDELTEALFQNGVINRVEASWVVMRQFWAQQVEVQLGVEPECLISRGKILRSKEGGLFTYPLTPERNLWMYRWI